MENKTAEQIYDHNHLFYFEWGTLKLMCLASMQQYADQETASLRAELAAAQQTIKELKEWIHSHV